MDKFKSKKGLVIAIAASLAIICVIGIAAYAIFSNTPEARLAKGFAKWANTQKKEDIATKVFGIDEILDSMMYGATQKDMSFNVTLPAFDLPTIGVDIVDACDYPNQKDMSEMELSVSNIELLTMQIAADSEKFYISMPSLLDDTYHVSYEGFKEKFNNSIWAEILSLTIEDDMQINPWILKADKEESKVGEITFSEEFMEAMEVKMAEMAKTMVVEETDATIQMVREGKAVQCDNIRVIVSKDDMNAVLDMIQEEMENGELGDGMLDAMKMNGTVNADEVWEEIISIFNVRFVEDFQLDFYLDKKNSILRMNTPQNVVMDNGVAVGMSVDFEGGKNPTKILGGECTVIQGEETDIQVEFTYENATEGAKETSDFEMEFAVSKYGSDPVVSSVDISGLWDGETNEFIMSVSADELEETVFNFAFECQFTDIVKGESLSMEIGKCTVNYKGAILLKLTGDFAVMPLTEEVKIPSESIDALELKQKDLQKILLEILGNSGSLLNALEEFDIL